MTRTTVDYSGLRCPLPVLRANKVIKSLGAGEELAVIATDPAAPKDFESYCATAGHELLETTQTGEAFTIVVRKRGG